MELKDLIRERRLEIGKTMEEIAKETGVSKATVQRWESGEIKDIRRSKIVDLAKALNVAPAYLMGWQKEKPTNDADDGLSEIAMIFSSLSPDNRAKFLELGRLYLASQRNKD